jgi:hypothetical protein
MKRVPPLEVVASLGEKPADGEERQTDEDVEEIE